MLVGRLRGRLKRTLHGEFTPANYVYRYRTIRLLTSPDGSNYPNNSNLLNPPHHIREFRYFTYIYIISVTYYAGGIVSPSAIEINGIVARIHCAPINWPDSRSRFTYKAVDEISNASPANFRPWYTRASELETRNRLPSEMTREV